MIFFKNKIKNLFILSRTVYTNTLENKKIGYFV